MKPALVVGQAEHGEGQDRRQSTYGQETEAPEAKPASKDYIVEWLRPVQVVLNAWYGTGEQISPESSLGPQVPGDGRNDGFIGIYSVNAQHREAFGVVPETLQGRW